jgi:hypothetical protein
MSLRTLKFLVVVVVVVVVDDDDDDDDDEIMHAVYYDSCVACPS